jgi:hypothetical protein
MFYFYGIKKEVHRWASRGPETLGKFMQNLSKCICGKNQLVPKILRGIWKTKEHKLLMWTVLSTPRPHTHASTPRTHSYTTPRALARLLPPGGSYISSIRTGKEIDPERYLLSCTVEV